MSILSVELADIEEISRGAGRARCGGQRRRPGGAPGGICGRDGNRDTGGYEASGGRTAVGGRAVGSWTELRAGVDRGTPGQVE